MNEIQSVSIREYQDDEGYDCSWELESIPYGVFRLIFTYDEMQDRIPDLSRHDLEHLHAMLGAFLHPEKGGAA